LVLFFLAPQVSSHFPEDLSFSTVQAVPEKAALRLITSGLEIAFFSCPLM
jgi:hypothetical protein